MTREATGLVLIPVVLLVVLWAPREALLAGLLVAGVGASIELGVLLRARGRAVQPVLAVLGTSAVVLSFVVDEPFPAIALPPIVVLAGTAAMVRERDASRAADALVSTTFTAVWVGLGLGSLLGVRVAGGDGELGRTLLLFCLVVTWVADSAAYYGGRAVGRRPLSWVSPGKTREGTAFGLVFGVAAAAASAPWIEGLPLAHAVALGLVVSVAGVLGDLAESLQKRAAGRKDSGRLLPGHGGVLDRVDSLLLAGPVAWLYGRLMLWG